MTPEMHIGALLRIGVGLLVLIPVVLMWRRQRLDELRQDLFILRDEMFDYAASGAIDFNHPAYGMVRMLINGFIRFGHRLSFTMVALVAVGLRVYPEANDDGPYSRLLGHVKTLSPEAREAILRTHGQVMVRILKYIFWGAPILWGAALCWLFVLFLRGSLRVTGRGVKQRSSSRWSQRPPK